MSGNFRSGRKSTKQPETIAPDDKPVKPKGLCKAGSELWDSVIATAKHLRKADSQLCQSCCELWGLYRAAYVKAKKYSGDKESRIAVKDYFIQWKAAMQSLCLDPHGRSRIGKNVNRLDVSKNPLGEFGIVG